MRKPKAADKRTRKTVELPTRLDDAVVKLAEQLGVSVSEVLRIAADRLVREEQRREEGFQIGAFKEDEEGRVLRAYLYDL